MSFSGKTSPEASGAILTACDCPAILISRPEVRVGSQWAPSTYKALAVLFKIALWSQMAASALVITPVFQRAGKRLGRTEGICPFLKDPKASPS